jgi:FkbM family methyltransferase
MTVTKLKFSLAGKEIEFVMSIDADNKTDEQLMFALRVAGCPEPEVSDLMMRAINHGDYAIDGGANLGFFTLLLSKLAGPDGYVYAFEPGANNLYKLKENVKLNGWSKNIEIIPSPLWYTHESVALHLCADGSKNSLAAHTDTRGSSLMESVVLDDYETEDAIRHLKLIKLDIEGAEEAALRGGSKLIVNSNCPYIVIELNVDALPKFESSPSKVCEFLRDYGYSPFLLHPNGALPTYIPLHTKVSPQRLNWNVLFSTFDMVSVAWPEISV